MSPNAKRPLLNLARAFNLLLALAIAAFVIASVDRDAAWDALRGVRPGYAVATVLLNLPFAVLFTLRSRLILTRLGHVVPLRVLAPLSVLGNVAGTFTPAAAGEYLRVTAFRSANVPSNDAITLVLYERAISMYLFLLTAMACIALVYASVLVAIAVCLLCVVLCALPWAIAALLLPRLPPSAGVMGGGRVARLARYALGVGEQLRVLLIDAGLFLRWSLLTLAIFGLLALQLRLLASSVSESISFLEAWIAMAGTGLAIILSLLPFGAGIGDGSLTAILTRMGIDLEQATAIAILLRVTSTLPLLAMAGAAFVWLQRQRAAAEAPAEQSQGIEDI